MRQLQIFINCNAHLVRDMPVICGNIARLEDTLIIYCNMKRYIDWADRPVPEYFDHVESSPLLGVYGRRSGRDFYRAIPNSVGGGSLSCHTCFGPGGIFIVPYLLWHGASDNTWSHPKDRPGRSVASYNKQRELRICFRDGFRYGLSIVL